MVVPINVLRVPIQINGLYINTTGGSSLCLPMADFSKLPYYLANGNTVNANPKTPNLAEAAFNDFLGRDDGVAGNALTFPKGLHLHWALPDALTTGHNRNGSTQFPEVPNRWLVQRLDSAGHLEQAWIVESDFLHPLDTNDQPTYQTPPRNVQGHLITAWPSGKPITFPTKRIPLSNNKAGAAFRFMGRSLLLSEWLQNPNTGSNYLNQSAHPNYKLTALGYGEPAFAAYYPNCYSIFGFCDVDPSLDPNAQYEYQIIGWFNEAELDPLQSSAFTTLPNDASRYQALKNEYRWTLTQTDMQKMFPERTVCYASLTLTPKQALPWQGNSHVDIALANSGSEALAALLADEVAGQQETNKQLIEDQLEALNTAPVLQGVTVDYQAHFDQTRHRRGFVGVGGGSCWAVLPKRTHHASAADASQNTTAQPQLPDAVAHALDALNSAQAAYDQIQQEITELQYQTFSDWHKFLAALYSNSNWLKPFRQQSSDMVNFIKSESLGQLEDKLSLAGGTLVAEDTRWTAVTVETMSPSVTLDLSTNTFTPAMPSNSSLAIQVLLRLKALIDAIAIAKLSDYFEISNLPAEKFWRSSEPAVLLSGDVAVSTLRHGEDGDLACAVLTMPDVPGTKDFIDQIDTLKPIGNNSAIQTQSASPWHPILLEWSVSVNTVSDGRTSNPAIANKYDYEPTFITSNFTLAENEPDLAVGNPAVNLHNSYEGRCVMTPTAGTQIQDNLSSYLEKTTLYDIRDLNAQSEVGYLDRLITWYQQKHNQVPSSTDTEKVAWAKQQRPLVDEYGHLLSVADLLTWYSGKPVVGIGNTVSNLNATQQAQDPVYTALRALSQLSGMTVLSQVLSGFNAALMNRQQALQIPIEDPLGTSPLLDFTNRVAQNVGAHHPTAPLSDKVFCPIRSGNLSLSRLRLIDTFGQQWNAPLAGVRLVRSNAFTNPNQSDRTYLAPRFSAPVRLNFRWLAALSGQDGDEIEMNSTPATTPVCGWLIPNNFDNSLMVFDNTGKALGSINTLAEWLPAPGSENPISAAEIPNPYLRRLARRLVIDAGTPSNEITIRQHFLESFISTVDSALEAIEPATFAQHEALALLMGHPIAVVRAEVDLQLKGQPSELTMVNDPSILGGNAMQLKKSQHWKAFADGDWEVFAYDWGQFYGCSQQDIINGNCPFLKNTDSLTNFSRTTHGFEKVVIPLRLGEHQLLNDGLVGYWIEAPNGDLDNVFHSPQTLDNLSINPDVTYRDGIPTPCIRAHEDYRSDNLGLSLQDDPLGLTILMDPRGVIHATCGVVPVRSLEIPSSYYAEVLNRMGVTFRVGPLLTDTEQLHAALPKEAGYIWSWVTKPNGSTWEETSDIADATEHAHFFKQPLLVDGWLKLTPKNSINEV